MAFTICVLGIERLAQAAVFNIPAGDVAVLIGLQVAEEQIFTPDGG
jgi:hypothetical protein